MLPVNSYLFLPFWYLCLYSYLCCHIILIVFKFIFVRPRSGRSRHQLLAAAQVLSQVCPLHLLCNASNICICSICVFIWICICLQLSSKFRATLAFHTTIWHKSFVFLLWICIWPLPCWDLGCHDEKQGRSRPCGFDKNPNIRRYLHFPFYRSFVVKAAIRER